MNSCWVKLIDAVTTRSYRVLHWDKTRHLYHLARGPSRRSGASAQPASLVQLTMSGTCSLLAGRPQAGVEPHLLHPGTAAARCLLLQYLLGLTIPPDSCQLLCLPFRTGHALTIATATEVKK
eukprot:g44418.t1